MYVCVHVRMHIEFSDTRVYMQLDMQVSLPFVPGSPKLATSVHKVEVEKIIHRIDQCVLEAFLNVVDIRTLFTQYQEVGQPSGVRQGRKWRNACVTLADGSKRIQSSVPM